MSVYKLLETNLLEVFNGCPVWGVDYVVPISTMAIILLLFLGIIITFWKILKLFTGGNKRKW